MHFAEQIAGFVRATRRHGEKTAVNWDGSDHLQIFLMLACEWFSSLTVLIGAWLPFVSMYFLLF